MGRLTLLLSVVLAVCLASTAFGQWGVVVAVPAPVYAVPAPPPPVVALPPPVYVPSYPVYVPSYPVYIGPRVRYRSRSVYRW